jgi:hypothetical protein
MKPGNFSGFRGPACIYPPRIYYFQSTPLFVSSNTAAMRHLDPQRTLHHG